MNIAKNINMSNEILAFLQSDCEENEVDYSDCLHLEDMYLFWKRKWKGIGSSFELCFPLFKKTFTSYNATM